VKGLITFLINRFYIFSYKPFLNRKSFVLVFKLEVSGDFVSVEANCFAKLTEFNKFDKWGLIHLMLNLAIDKYQEFKVSNCDIKNIFISLGCLVVKNYSEIILNYDHKLNVDIKDLLTLVINNLLLCNQLQNRIFNLKEEVANVELKLENLVYLNQKTKKNNQEQKVRLERSLKLKEKRLFQLNQENINILLSIGKWFYEEKLLLEKKEFSQLYKHLDYLLTENKEGLDWKGVLVEELDEKKANLYNLIQPYPNFLV